MEFLFRKLDLIEEEIDGLRSEERASKEMKLSIVGNIKKLVTDAREEARKSFIVPEKRVRAPIFSGLRSYASVVKSLNIF